MQRINMVFSSTFSILFSKKGVLCHITEGWLHMVVIYLTLRDIHSELQDIQTADQQLQYLYQNFPHHRDQLTPQAESALDQSKSWMNILLLPNTLKNILIPEAEDKEQKQVSQTSKGKQKETRVELDGEEDTAGERIWLGSDTPYKGPNKWFDKEG